MKINKHHTSKRARLITSLIIVLLLVGAGAAYAYSPIFHHSSNQSGVNSTNYGPATKDQKSTGVSIKEKSDNGKQQSGSDQPPAPTPIQGSNQSTVSMTITSANQTDTALQVRTLIGVVADNGTCTLSASKAGSATINQTAGVQSLASSSTCQGFNIPITNLSSGVWHIVVTYNSPTYTGTVSKDVTVN